MHGIDRRAVGGSEGDVELPGLGAASWAEPEVGNAVGASQTYDHALATRKTHHLMQSERSKDPLVEVEGRLHVGHLDSKMVKHGLNATAKAAFPPESRAS